MNTIIERITEAIMDILIGLIKSCLDNMFTSVNEQVGTIAGQVGQTPQGWNAGIFNLIQNISQTVVVPIAGLIITFVLCYELITMVTQKNNFHEFETYNIFLWIFKAYVENTAEVQKHEMEHCMATGIERSGVKRIRLHDLRHSHASMLVDMGVAPLEIAERLGHEKVETTLNTYSHLYPSTQSKLAGLLDKKHEEEEE